MGLGQLTRTRGTHRCGLRREGARREPCGARRRFHGVGPVFKLGGSRPGRGVRGVVGSWLELLATEGYRPAVRRGGVVRGRTRVVFLYRGFELELVVRPDAPRFFYLLLRVEATAAHLAAPGLAEALLAVGARLMCVKGEVSPAEGDLLFSVESFLPEPGANLAVFDLARSCLERVPEVLYELLPSAETLALPRYDRVLDQIRDPQNRSDDMDDLNSPENLAARWMEYLAEEGYRPKVEGPDEDGDHVIRFKVEGVRLNVGLTGSDPSFVFIHSYYSIPEDATDVDRLYAVAHETTASMKGAKAILDLEDRGVRFQMDLLLDDPARFGHAFERSTRILSAASEQFFSLLASKE